MGLFDVDKHSQDRGAPTPNSHDVVSKDAIKAHGTISSNYRTDASGSTDSGILMGLLRPVKTGTVTVVLDGGTLNTARVAHGLGFKPFMLAAIEHATATTAFGDATGVSFFLPTYLEANLSNPDGLSPQEIRFGIWLEAFVNDTYVYANVLNAMGITGSTTVTYYLFQQSPA